MAACAIRIRPSSHGPPPRPPITGIETALTAAGPATGPERVKSSSEAPASSRRLASSTHVRGHRRRQLRPGLQHVAVLEAVLRASLRGDPELREHRDAGSGDGAHRLGKFCRAVQFHHVRARLHQPGGSPQRGAGALLERTEGEVAAHHRACDPAANRLADHDHLVHRDIQRARVAPQIDPHRVSHGHDIHAGAIHDLRDLKVPGHDSDDLLAGPLHLLKRGNGDGHGRLRLHRGRRATPRRGCRRCSRTWRLAPPCST